MIVKNVRMRTALLPMSHVDMPPLMAPWLGELDLEGTSLLIPGNNLQGWVVHRVSTAKTREQNELRKKFTGAFSTWTKNEAVGIPHRKIYFFSSGSIVH